MNDLKFAFRQLLKNPGFTAVAVLTLALGIGANAAIFTVINTLMLRSLPVRKPHELVQVTVAGASGRDQTFTYPGYERLRNGAKSLSGLFAAGNVGKGGMVASGMGGTETEIIRPQPVTGNFFSVLGVQPLVGRLLSDADDRTKSAERVVVISYGFWQRRFGSDPSVIGKSITFFDVPVAIVGVTPPGFFGVQPGENPDLWLPINLMPLMRPQALGEGHDWLALIGRVRRGTDIREARAELAVAFQQYRAELAAAMSAEERQHLLPERLELQPAATGWTRLRDQFRPPLMILTVVVGLVLLIACANVASLMLARAMARAREFSIRTALGAHRLRLIRQLLTESVLLAGLGGLLGLFVAHWGARLLVSFAGVQPDPVSFDLAPDARVLCFTMGLSLATGLIFGVAPALRGSRSDLTTTMKGTGANISADPSRQFLQQSLVVVQVAMSLILLVGAGLFVRTLQKLKGMDMGFSRENVVLFQVGFSRRVDRTRRVSAYKELLGRVEESPGVRAASMSFITPLTEEAWGQQVDIEGYTPAPEEVVRCRGMSVACRYFDTMGTPILSGRDFGPKDERLDASTATNAPGVAIINESMARKYFGNANALGRRFSFFGNFNRKFEIVGVVKDAKYSSLREPVPPTFYLFCFGEVRDWDMTFAVRMAGKPVAVIDGVRRAVGETDPTLHLRGMRTMDDVVDASLRQERIIANLAGFFSLTALALACLGIYGALSFTVAQRTREIGLRIALGAQRVNVLSFVVGQGVKLAVIGSAIGLVGALTTTRLVLRLLYGISPIDPVTFAGVSVLLAVVAMLASWLPARRAAKVDPMDAPGPLGSRDSAGVPFWYEIVGVVGDVKSLGLPPEAVPEIYHSYWQYPMESPTLIVRATGDASALMAAIQRETKSVIPNLPTPEIRLMTERVSQSMAQPRFESGLLSLFGALALFLSACGIYGVLAYSVAQRRREIGIRMALGAHKRDILTLVLRQGLKLTMAGVAIGLVSALALTRVIQNLLYGVTPTDPLTFAAVSLVLLAVALLACLLPARRAAKVAPMEALRYE